MTLYVAYNGAISATTALAVVQSYAAGAKCALQLGIPSGQFITLIGWGWAWDADPTAATAADSGQIEIASTATATTLTSHTTTTVKPWNDPLARASTMTMSTTGTAYGNAAINSNTTLRYADRRFIPMTGSFDYVYPSDMRPKFGAAAAAEFVQIRVSSTVTANGIGYIIWDEA